MRLALEFCDSLRVDIHRYRDVGMSQQFLHCLHIFSKRLISPSGQVMIRGPRIGRMDAGVSGRKRRIFRGVEEKLRIVKLRLEPGASVASVALANGVNANQVFRWKRQYERGDLGQHRSKPATALVPVTIAAETKVAKLPEASQPWPAPPCAGSITIEFPGRALLSIEGAADPGVIRAVLESLSR